jgi:uracil-DNA glycosylase family 4
MTRDKSSELDDLARSLQDCTRCGLAETRINVVVGAGSPDAPVMFVGEAPGYNEDVQGLPFVGAAGRLLDELLRDILGLSRDAVYIANVLKCRPPENRDPTALEVDTCRPFLLRQVDIISPRIICTLGNFATRTLTERREGITKLRRKVLRASGRYVFPMFHPAAALHRGDLYEDVRLDFVTLKKFLDSPELSEEVAGLDSSQMELF